MQGHCHDIGHGHYASGGKGERHYIAEEHPVAVARETTHEEEPHEQPQRVEQHVAHHHCADAKRPDAQHCGDEGHAQGEGAPEEGARLALGYYHIGEERGDGHRRARHAEYLDELCRGEPFLAYCQHDELLCHEAEAEEQGERYERREAHHLAEHVELAPTLVVKAHKHGLSHLRHHALHQREALEVPLVGLVVVARVARREVVAEQDVEHIVVDARYDGCGEYLARESEHAPYGGEGDAADGGSPGREIPLEEGVDAHVNQSLRGK